MLLKKLKLKNIRSYKNAEIDFPEGSTLLMGDIGSGKTSILLAVEFALFGLQPSQRGSSLLRNNEEVAEVRLELEIDGKEVIIERTLKRGSKTISQEDTSIIIDGVKEEGSVTEIKNRVLSLLSYPQEFAKKTNDLYKFTVYTPQEEMKQIILEPAETRLNTLRHIFGIDKYKRIGENIDAVGIKIRQDIRLIESQLEDTGKINEEIAEKTKTISEHQNAVVGIEKEMKEAEDKKTAKQTEIKELEAKIDEKRNTEKEREKAELMLMNKKEQFYSLEKESSALAEQIKEGKKFAVNEDEIKALKQRIATQEEFFRQSNSEYLEMCSKIQSDESKKREICSLNLKITGMQKCPTCLQEVNDSYKKNIFDKARAELEILENSMVSNTKKKDELRERLEQIKKSIDSFRDALSETEILKVKLQNLEEKEKRKEELESRKNLILKEVTMMQNHIKSFDEIIKGFEKYREEFEIRSRELQEIVSKEHKLAISKAEINREIQLLEKHIALLWEKSAKLEKMHKKMQNMKELESWLSNKLYQFISFTEKSVMLKLREEFSQLFSNWFSILVSDTLSVRLDETFSPIIRQQDYDLDYNFLSGGERTAVALAYRLALNQVINSILSKIKTHDLVILDEPTDGFSDSQLDKMRDVLNQLKVRQLILVSHEQKIEGFVDNIIRFKKAEGVTGIEK